MPTITELVKEPSPWKYCDRQPEVVEFEDGASDVPFTIVPFFPTLHSQNRQRSSVPQHVTYFKTLKM